MWSFPWSSTTLSLVGLNFNMSYQQDITRQIYDQTISPNYFPQFFPKIPKSWQIPDLFRRFWPSHPATLHHVSREIWCNGWHSTARSVTDSCRLQPGPWWRQTWQWTMAKKKTWCSWENQLQLQMENCGCESDMDCWKIHLLDPFRSLIFRARNLHCCWDKPLELDLRFEFSRYLKIQ